MEQELGLKRAEEAVAYDDRSIEERFQEVAAKQQKLEDSAATFAAEVTPGESHRHGTLGTQSASLLLRSGER